MFRLASVIGILAIIGCALPVSKYLLVSIAVVFYLLTGGWRWILLLSKTIQREIFFCRMLLFLLYMMVKIRLKNITLKDMLHERVQKHENKLALIMADTNEWLTFKETEDLCHRVANVFYSAGYRKGDVVSLYMENRIEYIPILLGLSMIGVVTSLINNNLRKDSLKHCISICDCKSIIFSESMAENMKEIEPDLKCQKYCLDKGQCILPSSLDLHSLMQLASTSSPPEFSVSTSDHILLYMYTSGTTGLPKAVIWRGIKNIFFAVCLPLFGLMKNDVLYQTLPLYHASGMSMTIGFLMNGCTTIIKKKFSASQYIEDCCKYNVTVINYIGETCRYILSRPKSIFDDLNKIRWAFGNGLRASLWNEFKDRLKIDKIVEFYGSTDGNVMLIPNIFGRVGAIGFRSILFPNNDLRLVKTDTETNVLLRGADGLALEVNIGEPGQAVGLISRSRKFDGYVNQNETKKKIAHDIITKGDSAFLTGDIMIRDEEGYYYFHDRTGDTFRWKGENVSTNEVEGLLSKVVQLTDICVYGVEVPGADGKAGMACVCDPDRKIDIANLPKLLNQHLPKYAQPIFLRLTSEVEVTGTFKFQKNRFRKEGFAPHECTNNDSLYFLNWKEAKYVAIDSDKYQQIMNNDIKF